jgi:hypothetical protein
MELDEKPAIVVRKLGPPSHLASQNDQLMSERRILRLKSAVYTENLIRVDDVMESPNLTE